jgi:ribonuclease G
MTKEIIVNAGELESRVAILENGRLMELHLEREPKIVGNIYRGRVTKVLKGMDAAFVDIGIERNAFLSASDVVPMDEEEETGGRHRHRDVPPITTLLKGNQEILCQVLRAPMGTKGARITTRLSLPGRYLVLMLNSGNYVGVSRKIEDARERTRLRAIASSLKPDGCSLIVRTEAEGKSEEELAGDVRLLADLKHRIEQKNATAPTPAIIHGDLTLIFRIIRDAFTRDVNRVVVDSPSVYENVIELVEMISPGLRNRVFLYDEAMPIFHAYNIEPEIERLLRRKVWLPSGGYLVVDQAEALTAIDVNTGRFVGSVELAETVLTTNLQAADEVARQLRLRDLGGIIVVDFIDMDNPRHRQQVTKAFEDALHRDRAKIKVHSISPLGLVEMTRKRTGDSLSRLLTEPCPYCSGIGRVQNPLTMALRVERELAALGVEHPETEAFLVHAHPRVIANMLGYEGEAQRDLEAYLSRPVYLRMDEDYHPNTYRLEHLSLEQALAAVQHLEEGETVEARVMNPDPELSLEPLASARGIYLVVPGLDAPVGAHVKIKVGETGTSFATGEPMAAELRGVRAADVVTAHTPPPLVPESILPPYLREELAAAPPQGMALLAPTSEALERLREGEEEEIETPRERRTRGGRRKRGERVERIAAVEETPAPLGVEAPDAEAIAAMADAAGEETPPEVEAAAAGQGASRRRRRRRGRGRGRGEAAEITTAEVTDVAEEAIEAAGEMLPEVAAEEMAEDEETEAGETAETPAKRRRRRGGRRRNHGARAVPEVVLEPQFETISPEAAAEALASLISAIDEPVVPPVEETEPPTEADVEAVIEAAPVVEDVPPVEEAPAEQPARKRRATTRRSRAKAVVEETPAEPAAMVEEAPAPVEKTPSPEAVEEVAAVAEEPVEEATVTEEPAPPVEEKKPRRRTTRRKATPAPETEGTE